jgi:hypothetical protein
MLELRSRRIDANFKYYKQLAWLFTFVFCQFWAPVLRTDIKSEKKTQRQLICQTDINSERMKQRRADTKSFLKERCKVRTQMPQISQMLLNNVKSSGRRCVIFQY